MLVMSPLRTTKFLFWQIIQYLSILAILILNLAQPSFSRYGTPIYPAVKDMAQVVYNTKGQWPNMTYMLSARVFSTSSTGLTSDPTLAPDISAFLPDVEDRISDTDQDPNTYPVTLYERALDEKRDEDREGTDNSYVHNGDLNAHRSSVDGGNNEDHSDMTLVREGSETEHQWKVVPHRLRGRNECTKSDMEQAELLNSDLKDKQLLDLPTTLYIGGLFESTDLQSRGRSEFHSAQMAIGHINEKGIIPGYKLDLVYNETACDPGIAMDALYNLIYCKPEMIMILGGACSEVTKTLGEIVPYWNLILFSYASISPALSKREVYKTFVSLAPADSSYNAARMLFIKHFKWDTVATIYEDTEMYSLAMADMAQTFEQNNISPKTAEAFDTDVAAKLENLKENDARIIIGGFSENAARKVICQAYKLKLFGKRHVWMLSGSFTKEWWKTKNDTSCTDDQLTEALQGYFTVASINALTGSMRMRSIGGLSTDDFIKEYYRNNGTSPISPHATNTYDAVWTIALTLKSVVEKGIKYGSSLSDYRLEHFEYETGSTMSQHFLKIIEELEFVGVSGPVSFNGPDRQGLAVIQQYQGGQMQVVALYEPDNESLNFSCDACVPVIWQGGRIPCDKNVIVMKLKAVDPTAFYTVCSLCILGVVLALFFLAFNLHNRSLKFIKLSSPILNNVAVIGCILVYLAVMLLGFDEKTMRQDHYPLVCTTRAFLFAAGFSLAFGSMFTKTYRVHQIFTRAHSGVIRSKLLRDKQLLFIIGALLVIDSSLITVWVVVDPMHQEKTNLSSQLSETGEDIIYISQLSRCQSTHLEKWMGVLYAYKGLMLVFGVYMAWETRNVKIPALNDSRYIGMNVYNVVIMSTIVVVLSNILSDQPTLSYAIQSTFIFLSTTGTLCLMFLPKIYAIMTSNGNPVITGTGITVQANIRRFDFSDKKELQYRAEIQNKVYKRELVALEEEISRLEMLLEIPAITYFRLTDELLSLMPEGEIDINVITASMRGGGLQSCPSISDADDMVSYFGESTDDSRQQMDDHGDEELGDGISGRSPKKIGGLKKRPNSAQYAEYELTFDEITDGLFMDKTDSEKKKKKGGWEKINISKLTSKGSKARAFFSGRRSASLRSVVTPPQTPSLPATSTSSGETTTTTVNTISPQVSLLSQRLQFQLKQAAQLSRQRLQHQTQSLPSPKPGLQRSFTQPSPPSSPSMPSKMKTGDALTPQGDQPKTVRFTVDSFEAGGGSEELEEETTVRSRRFEKEKYPGKTLDSLTLSASSSSLRIGSPSLLNLSASQSAMSISSIPVSPIANESTASNLGTESTGSSNLSSMKFSLHKILTPKILRELKLQNLKELQQTKQETTSEKPAPTPTPSTEVLPPLPPPSSSASTTDTTTTTTSASTTSDSSTTMITIASTAAPDDAEAVASTSSNTPSFTLASIIQLKRQPSSPTSSRSSAEIATTSEDTIGETMTPGDGSEAITPVPSIYVTGTAPKALPEEIGDSQESSASPSRQKPSTSSRSSFKSTSKTWAKAAARAAAKAATRAAARASAAAAAAASSVKSSSSSSLSSALSSSTSTSSTGLHLHLRSPELRTPNPQTPTPVRLASAGNEEGVAEEAAAQTSDPEQFDIPSAEGMEKVIDNERKIRIKRLQRDLTRIQKELQALDDLEYEVSYV